jgi:hypothetical protein
VDPADDKRAIDAIAAAFFAAFDNRGGRVPELGSLYDICIASCVVVKASGADAGIYTLREFIEPRAKLLGDGRLVDFHEREGWERTDVFGDVAQRFCSYWKSGVLEGEPFEAWGMKTMQLVRTDGRWRISAVAWSDEREGLAVPAEAR